MPKSTGTFADTLAAFGLAAVLSEIIERANMRWSGQKVKIRDMGPYYQVELPTELRQEWVEQCSFFSLAKPIHSAKYPVESATDVWDLDREWEKVKQSVVIQKTLGETIENTDQAGEGIENTLLDSQIAPEFEVLALLSNTPMQALKTYNRIVLQWHDSHEYFKENLRAILQLAATPDADFESVAELWSKSIHQVKRVKKLSLRETASQLLNPVQGQGQNHPKANRLDTRRNLDSFWLVEYLKAVGLWIVAIPREEYVDKKKKKKNLPSRKTYVIVPAEKGITLKAHTGILRKFASMLRNTTIVKMDCVTVLLYTQVLLEYSEAGQEDELDFEGFGPENVVAGFQVAHYKGLNQRSYTMLGTSFIGLPHWTGEIKTRKRVNELKDVVEEHLDVIRNIDEERGDGYNLLVLYRDFLSGGQLETFFDFAIGYSQYLTHELEQKHFWVKKFTTTNLRRLFMGTDPQLMEILETEGFRNIAYAIRHSTVIPQYLKQKGDTLYDVRYGLGMELKRKAAYPREFVAALGSFIQEYNQENVQKVESKKQPQRRKNVRTNDLDDIVRLVDKFGSELICNLLVAYGYAGDPREEPETT
jgi:hypothetical protein